MTTPLFYVLLFAVSLILFWGIGILISDVLDDKIGFGISGVITLIYVIIFCIATPNFQEMTENDKYTMLEKPECIDVGNVSLGCKKDYIVWQRDSIALQHKYDSVKTKLENIQKEILK